MENITTQHIFKKVLENEDFKKDYYMIYLDRFVYQTVDVEKQTGLKRKEIIINLLEAFNYLIENKNEMMSPFDVLNVANVVNKEKGIEGFRKINVLAGTFADWQPEKPNRIYLAMYSLFDNYYNVWNVRDIYEKEAAFHINLMRIHPFEDGNKRTAKLITNANLIRQNIPPVIITEDETEEYYNFINKQDVIGFANFLKSKSLQELNFLMSLYKNVNHIPITESLINEIDTNNIRNR